METQVIANSAPSTKSELPAISSYCCQTKGVINEIDFEWTVERLSFFGSLGIDWERLISGEFSDGSILKLDLYPSGDYLEIRLLNLSINMKYPMAVDITVCDENCKTIFQNTSGILGYTYFGNPSVVLRITKKSLLETWDFVNGKTTIRCKIKSLIRKQLTGKATTAEIHLHDKTQTRDNDKQDLILHQHEELFEKMPFLSDVTFNVRGQKFPAHIIILAMRSPVFAAMFQHPTKEMLSGNVEVEDVDPDVFQEVLRYLYTGLTRSTTLDVMAPELLVVADKYLLEELKTRCETHLIRKMSSKNCLDLLSLTTHHPAEHLKKYAVEYFRRYPNEVMGTDNWKKLKEENPALLCDLQQMVLTV
ncbi:TD and POZ domain-containing protein 4-like [Daphnia pulicaria]|uniref:TD and POZ domain-containing protein 4-like n=1 Tax=Daphnia pulicaria TaxID=35523 RepID=UPI001EEADB51|nr:TD and POZ domain-containing protein 4-like [Daphnia pulicaria]